jgi:glycosyltransferase involved in cell wall biosynthesis
VADRDEAMNVTARQRAASVDLAVLVHEFPKLSETFVLHDLLALEAAGVRLALFSLRRPDVAPFQGPDPRLKAEVRYLPEVEGRRMRLALRFSNALLLVRNPARYLWAMYRIVISPDYSRTRVNQAVLLATELQRLGSPPLYVHFAHKPATVGRFASLLIGARYAISAHAVDVWTPPVSELRVKVRDAETVLCCYEEARAHMARLAGGETPIALVHHGVELPPNAEPNERNPPVLLAVGRLVEKKGYPTLLEAAARLRDQGLSFEVRITGDGPEWATLQRQVTVLELGDLVRFIGPLTTEELEREYAAASVFVLPCQTLPEGNRDGIPNTLLEAMAHSLPVVSTTLASVAEAVDDDQHGLLVPERDPAALAQAIARLLADPKLRRRLGTAGRTRVAERFDRRECAPRVFEALAAAGMVRPRGR